MINNFQQIASLLQFDSEDEFYFLQLIKRKKENPELGSNNIVCYSYYINSSEHLLNLEREIIALCELNNARAYINLNRCSYEKVAFQTLKNVVDRIMNKDFRSVKRAYNTCCGQFNIENPKKWIIDIDKDPSQMETALLVAHIQEFIRELKPEGLKSIALIPTKNGYHFITTPFNMQQFKEKYPEIDVHKNNPTILYCI